MWLPIIKEIFFFPPLVCVTSKTGSGRSSSTSDSCKEGWVGGSGSGSLSSPMTEISKLVSVNKLHRESLISSSEVGKESGREGGCGAPVHLNYLPLNFWKESKVKFSYQTWSQKLPDWVGWAVMICA